MAKYIIIEATTETESGLRALSEEETEAKFKEVFDAGAEAQNDNWNANGYTDNVGFDKDWNEFKEQL